MKKNSQAKTKSFKLSNNKPVSLAKLLSDIINLTGSDPNYALWSSSKKDKTGSWEDEKQSYAILNPQKIIRIKKDKLEVFNLTESKGLRSKEYHKESTNLTLDPLDLLRNESQKFFKDNPSDFIKHSLLGILSYDSARYFEPYSGIQVKTEDPDLLVFFPGNQIFLDEKNYVLEVKAPPEFIQIIEKLLENETNSSLKSKENSPFNQQIKHFNKDLEEGFKKRDSSEEFQKKVSIVKTFIEEGDVFQAVLANTFYLKDKNNIKSYSPLKQLQSLSNINPSPYHYCFKFNDWSLSGASPEMFLQSSKNRRVSMRLVAGTYPRSRDLAEDEILKTSLLEDPKEKAEHIMLVDHARNDIGKVSKTASVSPEKLMLLETYSDLHHLLSVISGELKDNEDIFSAIRSCFPIATLTGTPKIRAMQIIEELEGSRGVYGGTVFCIDKDDTLNSAVIIRSIIQNKEEIKVPAGCGIVWDSIPDKEDNECLIKAKAVITSILNP